MKEFISSKSFFKIKLLYLSVILAFQTISCGGGGNINNIENSNGSIFVEESPLSFDPPRAKLWIHPNIGTYQIGESFNADILLDTGNQNVISVRACIKFDPTSFKVNAVKASDSFFPIENETAIDEEKGIIKISRSRYVPGINTDYGKVVSINFTAISSNKPNTDNVSFIFQPGLNGGSSVIVHDGMGTSILGEVFNAKYTVN